MFGEKRAATGRTGFSTFWVLLGRRGRFSTMFGGGFFVLVSRRPVKHGKNSTFFAFLGGGLGECFL